MHHAGERSGIAGSMEATAAGGSRGGVGGGIGGGGGVGGHERRGSGPGKRKDEGEGSQPRSSSQKMLK